jgi:hypothetical protein
MATPLFAQEGGGDVGFGGLFGMGDAPRGANAPPPDRLVQLRKILLDANAPLTKDQESSISKMLDTEIKRYTTELEKKYPQEVAQARAASDARGRGGAGGGDRRSGGAPGAEGAQGRGGSAGGRGQGGSGLPPNSPLLPEMTRINAELQGKVIASLQPAQQTAFQKHQNDQIKKAGGFGALKLILQESGAALTPDQETQIQAFYADEDQQRRQLLRESQGQADPARLSALTNGTMLKVVKVLNADQKKLFLDALKKQQQQ